MYSFQIWYGESRLIYPDLMNPCLHPPIHATCTLPKQNQQHARAEEEEAAEAAKVHFSPIGLLTFGRRRHTADSRTGGRGKEGGGNFLMVSRPTCVEGSGRQLEGGKGDKKAFGNFRRLNLPNHVRYFFFFFWHLCDIVFPNVSNIHIVETFLQKKWRNQVHRAFIWLWRGWRTLSGGDVHLVPTFFISSSYSPFSRSFSFSFWHFYRKHVIAAISPSLYLSHTKIGIFFCWSNFPPRVGLECRHFLCLRDTANSLKNLEKGKRWV